VVVHRLKEGKKIRGMHEFKEGRKMAKE